MPLLRLLFITCCGLFGWVTVSIAEQDKPINIYSKSTQANRANINKTVEFIRDPTKGLDSSLDKLKNSIQSKVPSLSAIKKGVFHSLENEIIPTTKTLLGLHDPTQMSGNFRQALKSYNPPKETMGTDTTVNALPAINLVGKVFIPREPSEKANKKQETSSVVLSVDGTIHHFKEGGKSTFVVKDQIVTVSVELITQQFVKIRISPSNEILRLH